MSLLSGFRHFFRNNFFVSSRRVQVVRQNSQLDVRVEYLEDRTLLSSTVADFEPVEEEISESGFSELDETTYTAAMTVSEAAFDLSLESVNVGGTSTIPQGEALFDLSETFALNSLSGAKHTIYLDFDGHTTSGTQWNTEFNSGLDIITAPYSFEGDATFTDDELQRIQRIWASVAEDFAPFEVNVTTQYPGLDALSKSDPTDDTWGVRVVIGENNGWYSEAGGVAYVGSFDSSLDTPVFVFNNTETGVAEAASHEVGHALGLGHDGTSTEEYYEGHGTDPYDWGPIMGAAYNRGVSQWSIGEYNDADNQEDDLDIITGQNGFGYRADDYGNDYLSAQNITPSGTIEFDVTGLIEQNTDEDFFSFTTSGGIVALDILASAYNPNLDILAKLYDSSLSLISTSDPADSVNASFLRRLAAGTYYLSVTGTGSGDPLTDGYSDYGSLGNYSITGSLPSAPVADAGGPYFVHAGDTVFLSAMNSFDAQQSASYLYFNWDLDGNGVFGEFDTQKVNGLEQGRDVYFSTAHLSVGDVVEVSVKVSDDDLLEDIATTTIEIISPPVELEYVNRFGGIDLDLGTRIVTDSADNVYTIGAMAGTADFDYGSGNTSLTSNGSYDIVILKQDSEGNLLWTQNIGGSGIDVGTGIDVDDAGNIYATGYFDGTVDFDFSSGVANLTSQSTNDVFVLKLDTDGNFVWAKNFSGSEFGYGNSISVDDSGNVYTAGAFAGTADFDPGSNTFNMTSSGELAIDKDAFITKLDSNGNFVWARQMGGELNDEVSDLGIDSTGAIYSIGYFSALADFDPGSGVYNLSSSGDKDIFISKLDSSGNFVWAQDFGGATADQGYALDLDASDNIYATGFFTGEVDFDRSLNEAVLGSKGDDEIFVAKYDSSGNYLWAKAMGGPADDTSQGISVDADGNVYSIGTFAFAGDFDPGPAVGSLRGDSQTSIYVSKLDSSGNHVWALDMGGDGDDIGRDIALDSSGNIYATGYFSQTAKFDAGTTSTTLNSAGYFDAFVMKLVELEDLRIGVDNTSVTVDEGATATNSGTYNDPSGNPWITASVGTVTDNNDGTWSWSLDTTDGPDESTTVTISMTDENNTTKEVTFDLTVNNLAPTIAADNATVTVNQGVVATNSGTFSDAGDDTVTLTSSRGTVIKNSNGTWSWSYDTNGTYPSNSPRSVTITATDSDGDASQVTFNLIATNVPPSLTVDASSVTVNEGATATMSGTFSETDDSGVWLTASLGSISVSAPGVWSWSYDTTDGPDNSQTVTITASDELGEESEVTFDLTVNNLAPTIAADNATVTVNEGDTATNTGTYSDAGDDTVTVTASVGNITDKNDGTWSWSFGTSDPADSQTVTITATDSDGAQTQTTFELIVNGISNTAPTADAGGPYLVQLEETTMLDGSASTDSEQDPTTLTYEWDLDGDGNFGETGTNALYGDETGINPIFDASSVSTPQLFDIDLKVTDAGGLSHTSSSTVEVIDTAPDFGYAIQFSGTEQVEPYELAVDSNDNVYTLGYFRGTADFDPGTGVYNLTSAGERDAFITKTDSSGNLIWAKRFGNSNTENVKALFVDSSGNVFITGRFYETVDFDPGAGTYNLMSDTNSYNGFVLKLDTDGDFVWARSLSGGFSEGSEIAIDSAGDVFITGNFSGTVDFDPGTATANLTSTEGKDSGFLLKLDSNGDYLWAQTNEATNWYEYSTLAVDNNDNLYISGEFTGTVDFDAGVGQTILTNNIDSSFFISKLDNSGNLIWVQSMSGPAGKQIESLTTDSAGNIYFTGYFTGTVDFDPGAGVFNLTANSPTEDDFRSQDLRDAFVAKLDQNGDFVWATSMGSGSWDQGLGIAVDDEGNIYTSGFFEGTVDFDPGSSVVNLSDPVGNRDAYLTKYDSAGNLIWAENFAGAFREYAERIVLDSVGNIYTTGAFSETGDFDPTSGVYNLTSAGSAGGVDTFILKLIQNHPPTITSDNNNVTTNEGTTATNIGTYSDPENDTVTLTASVGNITDNNDGTWSWSWNTTDGPDDSQTVTVTATDAAGNITQTTFDLTVNNLAPTVAADNATVTVNEGDTATNTGTYSDAGDDTVTVTASVGNISNNNGTWSWSFGTSDPADSQTVTITATDSDGTQSQTTFVLTVESVTVLPTINVDHSTVTVNEGETATNSGTYTDNTGNPWITASVGTVTDNNDGTWSWSLDTTDGPDESATVTVSIVDENNNSKEVTFDLTVNNLAPSVAADNATVTVNEGDTATNTGTYSDAGNDTVTVTASVGNISNNNGTWSWSFGTSDPADSQTVTITATDSDGAQSTTSFELTVEDTEPPTDEFPVLVDFNDLWMFDFRIDSQSKWEITYHNGSPALKMNSRQSGLGIAVLNTLEGPLPNSARVSAEITSQKGAQRAYLIFDYKNDNDFKYAGFVAKQNQWRIGHYQGSWSNPAAKIDWDNEGRTINNNQVYNLDVILTGNHAELIVDGESVLSATFNEVTSLTRNSVGIASYKSIAVYDNFEVDKLTEPVLFTEYETDFKDGFAEKFSPVNPAQWSVVNGQLVADTSNYQGNGLTLFDMEGALTSSFNISADITAVSGPQMTKSGFIIFDYHSPDDFKFAGMLTGPNKWVIGQYNGGWKNISTVDWDDTGRDIKNNQSYHLEVHVDGNVASLTVDGEFISSATFNGVTQLTTGQVGLANKNGITRFDNFRVAQDILPSPSAIDRLFSEEEDLLIF